MSKLSKGTVHVFTFKDGLLARLAHDLRLSVGRWEVELGEGGDAGSLTATFWPNSIEVNGAVKRGSVEGMSGGDRAKIKGNINDTILKTSRYGEIRYVAKGADVSGDRFTLDGELTLRGKTERLRVDVVKRGGAYTGRVTLEPSRWGISPYKAMGGAIKLKDTLRVEFEVQAG